MSKKRTEIIEPPIEEDLIPTYKDPPLTPHGDMKLDEKGHIIEEDVAKTFEEALAEIEEAEDW